MGAAIRLRRKWKMVLPCNSVWPGVVISYSGTRGKNNLDGTKQALGECKFLPPRKTKKI